MTPPSRAVLRSIALLTSWAILNSPFSAVASPVNHTIEINWKCPYSYPDSNPTHTIQPKSLTFEFQALPDAPGLHILKDETLTRTISELEAKEKDVDFYSCLRASLFDLEAKMEERKIVLKNGKQFEGLRAKLVEYGKKKWNDGARSPILPFSKSSESMTQEEIYSKICSIPWNDRQKSFFLGKGFIENTLPTINFEKPCRDYTAQAYSDAINRLLPTDSQCDSNPSNCELLRNRSLRALLGVKKALSPVSESVLDSVIPQPVDSCFQPKNEISYQLMTWANQAQDLKNCAPLKNGEVKEIDSSSEHFFNHYNLKLETLSNGQSAYTAGVPIQFADPSGMPNPDLDSKYREIGNACLSTFESKLKGPGNESLKIKLVSASANPDKDAIVRVIPKLKRADSKDWASDITCPTILHEVLHLFGLADEYSETEITPALRQDGVSRATKQGTPPTAYDCRIKGPKTSVMHSQLEALQASFGSRMVIECNCGSSNIREVPGGAQKCESAVARIKKEGPPKSKSCPPETEEYKRIGISEWEFNHNPEKRKNFEKELGYRDLKSNLFVDFEKVIPPVRDSLLLPAQFKLITRGGCYSENKIYLQCSSVAYKTSRENYGEGCSPVPKECSNGSFEWLMR